MASLAWEQSLCVGSVIPRRQVKNEKTCSKTVSEHPQVCSQVLCHWKHFDQHVATRSRGWAGLPSCLQAGRLCEVWYLLRWASAVDSREVQVMKTAFQVQRTSLWTGFFPHLCWGLNSENHCGIVVFGILRIFQSFCYFIKYESREILVMLCASLECKY